MKHCGRCNQVKPLGDFHLRGDGRQTWCKECRRVYDAAYHQRVKERRLAQKRELDAAFRSWARSLKEGKPCADCGQVLDASAMQWDHLPGVEKAANVGDLVRRHNRRRLLAEIAKCELVCANCHAVRTLRRRGA